MEALKCSFTTDLTSKLSSQLSNQIMFSLHRLVCCVHFRFDRCITIDDEIECVENDFLYLLAVIVKLISSQCVVGTLS